MLVAISDIHFTDGTAGEHNLPVTAFRDVFLSDIAILAREKKVKELKVLLLGDVIDLIRSERWFEIGLAERPWGDNGIRDVVSPRPDSPTEKKALEIIGRVSDDELKEDKPPKGLDVRTVLYKNWSAFKLFRELGAEVRERVGEDLDVEVIYIPGNHDRLCNLYPSVRDEFRRILGLKADSSDTDWRYRNEYFDEEYGIFARHGHQHDLYNYGALNDFTERGHLQVPIGDVLTTEFAVKLPWKLAQLKSEFPEITDAFITKVKDIDNVRPLSGVIEWIYYRIKSEDSGQVRKALDRVFDETVKELLEIGLVQSWRSPATYYDEIVRSLSSKWLKWIPRTLMDMLDAEDMLRFFLPLTGEKGREPLTEAAYKESIWRDNPRIRYILYGHTHTPMIRPLDRMAEREVIYVNTGTWRNRIVKTVEMDRAPDFVELKQMTFTILYRADEDTGRKVPGTVSLDTWTGYRKKYYAPGHGH